MKGEQGRTREVETKSGEGDGAQKVKKEKHNYTKFVICITSF